MKKTLIAVAAALVGAAAGPAAADAGTIACDAWAAVERQTGPIAHCIDDPNPVDDAVKDVLGLIELT